MKGKKLAALILGAFLTCGMMVTPVLANVPEEAEKSAAEDTPDEEMETEVPASRISDDINGDAELSDEVTGADGRSLTPEGNLSLVDDILTESGKQFITLTTRDGNYYYLIIDRSNKDQNNVYFLNQVDERDLFSVMNEDDLEAIEKEKQEEADREARERAEARKAAEEAQKQKEEAASEAEDVPSTPEKASGTAISRQILMAAGVVIALLLAGIVIFAARKKKKAVRSVQDPDAGYEDDYDDEYASDEEEDEYDETGDDV
jgi:hypothetical protein